MEGTHGELGARLADGLGGNNTYRFTRIDHRTATEIASVTLGAQTITSIASQRSTNLYFVNTKLVDQVNKIFVQHGTCENNGLLRFRIDQIVYCYTTKNTLTQRLDNLTTLDQGLYGEAVGSTTEERSGLRGSSR